LGWSSIALEHCEESEAVDADAGDVYLRDKADSTDRAPRSANDPKASMSTCNQPILKLPFTACDMPRGDLWKQWIRHDCYTDSHGLELDHKASSGNQEWA
jgi:hypothetical protein